MNYVLALILAAGILAAATLLAVAIWRLAAAVRILIAIVRDQAGVPTRAQNDEIDRLMRSLG